MWDRTKSDGHSCGWDAAWPQDAVTLGSPLPAQPPAPPSALAPPGALLHAQHRASARLPPPLSGLGFTSEASEKPPLPSKLGRLPTMSPPGTRLFPRGTHSAMLTLPVGGIGSPPLQIMSSFWSPLNSQHPAQHLTTGKGSIKTCRINEWLRRNWSREQPEEEQPRQKEEVPG